MIRRRAPQISLLVPFRADDRAPERAATWAWLRSFWGFELPDAEIVIGRSRGQMFSKTEAVNDAARHATGRIFVILDSDCFMRGSVIKYCADEIDAALRRGNKLWFIPYRQLYRLTQAASAEILTSDPRNPLRPPHPPASDTVESILGSMHGRRFGALIQIMPREAFEEVGGMDPRFQGWGGEDISFVRAVDTLYIHHKTTPNDVLHLWHANIGQTSITRMWQGQRSPRSNENLASRYSLATGDRVRMQRLVAEGARWGRRSQIYIRRWWPFGLVSVVLPAAVVVLVLPLLVLHYRRGRDGP